MSDHLPECAERRAEWRWSEDCICDRLRACEQRVREGIDRVWDAGWERGRAAGVQAARDAVAGLPWDNSGAIDPVDALAAIDALRGES